MASRRAASDPDPAVPHAPQLPSALVPAARSDRRGADEWDGLEILGPVDPAPVPPDVHGCRLRGLAGADLTDAQLSGCRLRCSSSAPWASVSRASATEPASRTAGPTEQG